MRATLVRVRTFAGYFAVLAVLSALTALLVTAVPRIAGGLADDGLRQQFDGRPAAVRDTVYRYSPDPYGSGTESATVLADRLDTQLAQMPPAVRRLIDGRWYSAETAVSRADGPDLRAPGPPVDLILRAPGGAREAATLTAGRWAAGTGQVVVSVATARALGLRVGSRLALTPPPSVVPAPYSVTVVGLFTARNPADGIWDPLPPALTVTPPSGRKDPDPVTAVALTSDAALTARQAAGWPIAYTWRYRADPGRMTSADTTAVLNAVRVLDRTHDGRFRLTQGLGRPLQAFVDAQDAARGVLFIVLTGVLATVAGLVVLTARLLARRRGREFALLRARGAAATAVFRRSVAEALLVGVPAAIVGWAAGGGGTAGRPAAVAALIIAAAFPLAALVGGSPRHRLTLEALILLLAVAGIVLLRRRGLPPAGRVDPLLVAVPLLLTVAAATLMLRAYPWLLGAAGRLAARARGAIAFLGVALARRATTGSLVVVVIAVAGAAFCAAAAGGIRDGRAQATTLAVPADALVTGDRFAPDTAGALGRLPGVRAVSPLVAQPAQSLARARGGSVPPTYVLVVDPATFAGAARGFTLPGALTGSTAVVSPDVAADVGGGGTVTAQNRGYPFRVGAVADSFPAVPAGNRRFVVLAGRAGLTPTGFLVAGAPIDVPAVLRAADQGRRRYYTGGAIAGRAPDVTPVVTTRAAVQRGLSRDGANGLLSFGFTGGVLGGSTLALAAVVFAVMADAPARSRMMARLATMGLSRRQRNRVLIVELAPPVGLAVLSGALMGILLPLLVGPVLRLSTFTGGVAVGLRADPRLAAAIVVFGLIAAVLAVTVETAADRRPGRERRLREED